LTYNLFEHEY